MFYLRLNRYNEFDLPIVIAQTKVALSCMEQKAALYGHTYSSSKSSVDQSGQVANPAHGQLNREHYHFLVRVRA